MNQLQKPRKHTPRLITILEPNQIIVFGSNTQGRHGKGLALTCLQKFGAVYGKAIGIQGNSYAIVTKELRYDKDNVTLCHMADQLHKLAYYAKDNPDKEFLVTLIGTGLANFTLTEMQSIFKFINLNNIFPDNVILPLVYDTRSSEIII